MTEGKSAWLLRRLQQQSESPVDTAVGPAGRGDSEWGDSPLLAKALQDGTFLDLYATSIVSDFLRQPCAEYLSKPSEATLLTYGTMCSGSDICRFSLKALTNALRRKNIEVAFSQRWACESDLTKQQWLKCLHGSDDICIFRDAKDMGGGPAGEAPCETHGRCCSVTDVDCFLVGFSCKEFSRANTSASATKGQLLKTGIGGSSVETYKCMMAFIEKFKPRFITIENSDALCDGSDKVDANVNVLLATLSRFGYDSQAVLLNTPLFGLPNRRPRTYIISILKTENIQNLDLYFKNFISLLERAKRDPPSALDVLLPKDDPHVADWLSIRQGKPRAGWEPGSIDLHQKHYAAKGLRWGSIEPDSNTKNSSWYGTLTAREKDTLVFNMHMHPQDEAFDISQSIYRVPKSSTLQRRQGDSGGSGILVSPAILPRALIWWKKEARLQLGIESLMMAGFPIALRPDLSSLFSNDAMQNLAGNCFSATIISAVFACYLALTPRHASGSSRRRIVAELEQADADTLDESESQADSSQTVTEGGASEALSLLRLLKRARSE